MSDRVSLEDIRYHPLAECEKCPLREEGTYVPSVGPDKADIVLVGEAPGGQEVRTGEPFTGPSGQLLNSLLGNIGVGRGDVYITNVCLCRPRSNANPPSEAVRACADRLHHEISERLPHTIVALGNFAARSILQTNEGITKLRVGPPKRSDAYPGVRIIPTFHPAASLYNPGSFPDIVTDFGKVRYDATSARTNWSPPVFDVITDPSDAESWLVELLESGSSEPIAIDIEVGIEKDVDFDHPDRYRLLCIGISRDSSRVTVLDERVCNTRSVLDRVGRVLEAKPIIAQNGKFDLQGLWHIGHGRLWFDTMLAHYCLDERRGTHGLDVMAIEYLGSPDWKSEISRYVTKGGNYADIPRDVLYKYNAYDVANTYRLYELFSQMLKSEGLERTHEFLVRSSNTLMAMERNGVAVDLAYLETLEEKYTESLAELEGLLAPWVDNPRSPKQVKEALGELGVKRITTTNREALETFRELAVRKDDDELYQFTNWLLTYRKEQKLYGTYVKGIRERVYGGRVHPTFLLHGTVTGRLSSRNPNLQNIPRGSVARKLFSTSSPDNVLIQADYRQAEYRVVCWLARDSYLREIFSDDARDLHGEVAERFYGTNWTKEQRVRAKAVVFGLTYGREAYSIAAEYGMSVAEAQHFIDTYFDVIPDTVKWIESVEKRVLEGHDLVSPFGRRRRFWLISDANRKDVLKEARAFLPQSTASDLTLESANRLAEAGLGEYLRIPVHDALVLEVPQKEADEVAHLVAQAMRLTGEELFEGYIPAPVDVGIGRSWGELE